MKIKFAPFAALKLVSHCVFRFSFVFSKSLSKAPKSVGFGWGGGWGREKGGEVLLAILFHTKRECSHSIWA